MTDETTAIDEARRRILALWDPPPAPTRGRPARIARAQIVEVGVELADDEGLGAVSMRSVARRLEVGAMTLYSHVGGRRELLDLMVDRAYGDFVFADPGLSWRDGLERHARGMWQLIRRHPWLVDLNFWRLPLGPRVFDVEEAGYRTLVDTGLSPRQVVEVMGVVQNFVLGFARSVAVEEAEARDEGLDYETYWRSTADFWENHFDPDRYPSMTRLWSSGAFDEEAGPFDVPLSGLLDTIGLLIERAQAEGSPPIPGYRDCMSRYDERVEAQVEEFMRRPAD